MPKDQQNDLSPSGTRSSSSPGAEARDRGAQRDPQPSPRTAVAVFAHPDDDLTIGPLLAHYAKRGADVYLLSVTSGQRGTAHTEIAAGPELAKAREAELRRACECYGIHEPRFLRYEDGALSLLGTSEQDGLKLRVREILQEVGAQVLITFGSDGYTGHPDHVTVGAAVTELLDQWHQEPGATSAPVKLYYTMCPASVARQLPASLRWFVPVDDDQATTMVNALDGVAEAAAAADCYGTQFPPPLAADVKALYRQAMGGRVHLRCVRNRTASALYGEADIFA